MKKNLLIAVMVLPLLSVSAQWYQTGGTVKVKANTLKYVEGAHEVAGTSTESNEGKVHVNGDFTVGSTAEFRNEWTDATAYGQLIIDDESVASGNVISEYKNTDYNAFYKQSTAFPFTGVSAEEFAVQAGIETLVWPGHPGNGVFNNTRWQASVNTWDNQNYALDDMLSSETIETNGVYGPQRYYSINQMVDELQVRLSDYQGSPANTPHNLVLTSYTISAGAESVVNNYSRNIFGEMLGTYLKDAFVTIDYDAWSTNGRLAKPDGFAENLFYFGNPYTSNLDLRPSIPTDGSVVGIQQFSSNTFDPNTNQGNSNLNIDEAGDDITTFSGGSWTGDGENVLEVRPFHTFAIKTNGSLASIDLNDSNKTFNLEFNAPSYVDRTTGSNSNPLNQVKLQLFQDDLAISKSYIVAGTDFEAAAQAGNEAYNSTLSEEYASIYTLQENEDGTVNSELSNSLTYINGINELNYVAKPVMMALNIIEAGDFVLKGILSDDILNSIKIQK